MVSEEASKHEKSFERELQGINACFPKQSRWEVNAEGVSTTSYEQQQTTEFVDSKDTEELHSCNNLKKPNEQKRLTEKQHRWMS